MVVLGAIAGDTPVTIGNVKSQAGASQSWSPALAPKHLGRRKTEHGTMGIDFGYDCDILMAINASRI